jgi:hypothetical protein
VSFESSNERASGPFEDPATTAAYESASATIHNGIFIGGNVKNIVRHGESGMCFIVVGKVVRSPIEPSQG